MITLWVNVPVFQSYALQANKSSFIQTKSLKCLDSRKCILFTLISIRIFGKYCSLSLSLSLSLVECYHVIFFYVIWKFSLGGCHFRRNDNTVPVRWSLLSKRAVQSKLPHLPHLQKSRMIHELTNVQLYQGAINFNKITPTKNRLPLINHFIFPLCIHHYTWYSH